MGFLVELGFLFVCFSSLLDKLSLRNRKVFKILFRNNKTLYIERINYDLPCSEVNTKYKSFFYSFNGELKVVRVAGGLLISAVLFGLKK